MRWFWSPVTPGRSSGRVSAPGDRGAASWGPRRAITPPPTRVSGAVAGAGGALELRGQSERERGAGPPNVDYLVLINQAWSHGLVLIIRGLPFTWG